MSELSGECLLAWYHALVLIEGGCWTILSVQGKFQAKHGDICVTTNQYSWWLDRNMYLLSACLFYISFLTIKSISLAPQYLAG